jgi:hypothetical protein
MMQLENWKSDAASSSSAKDAKQQLEIVLPVPAGQEDLAELLIKGECSADRVLLVHTLDSVTLTLCVLKHLWLMSIGSVFEPLFTEVTVTAATS